MFNGVINVNKPAGWTSQDVCSKLRHRLHIRKIGHTGTLDPMATGVLPVCTGKATRIIEYYENDFKSYHAGMKLGLTSDTLDIWGDVRQGAAVRIAAGNEQVSDGVVIREEDLINSFNAYTGTVSQVPPKYSALKIDGKRAYDLAREGRDFEMKSREVFIASNEVTGIDHAGGEVWFNVTCSKGTYIRTICDDIGRTLGCGAVMSSLERTRSGFFDIKDAVQLEDLIEMNDDEIEKLIIPMDMTLTNLGIAELNDNRVIAFTNGNSSASGYHITSESHFALNKSQNSMVYRVYNNGSFLGTAYISGRELIPAKVIK